MVQIDEQDAKLLRRILTLLQRARQEIAQEMSVRKTSQLIVMGEMIQPLLVVQKLRLDFLAH